MFNVCTIKKLFARKGKKQFRSLISKKREGFARKKEIASKKYLKNITKPL